MYKMETINIKTMLWKEEKEKRVSFEEIWSITGKVPVSMDSKGNIKIDKLLSLQERAAIESLIMSK